MFPINPEGVIRYATEDVEVGGVAIPAGSAVMVGGPAAAFDPEVFGEPLRFDVTRSVNPHLSFGYGPHFCVGAALARAELQLTFVGTLRRFPGLRLAVPSSALRLKPSLAGGFEELPVTW
jgi:cytochrome P450